MGKGVEGSGRRLILRYYPGFTWRDWKKPQKASVRIVGLPGRNLDTGCSVTQRGALMQGYPSYYDVTVP